MLAMLYLTIWVSPLTPSSLCASLLASSPFSFYTLMQLLRCAASPFHESLLDVIDPLFVAAPNMLAAGREETFCSDLFPRRSCIVRLVVLEALIAYVHRLAIYYQGQKAVKVELLHVCSAQWVGALGGEHVRNDVHAH